MRFERLELLRFGKFTDKRLEFPSEGLDFHIVVGPNEAGKSTLRAAILDLLFGIEPQSPYDFVHAYPDMRLGAALSAGEKRLEFHRLKRTKNPFRDASDQPLRDDLLVPFLGGMDRHSFERMFCLDHERLIRGGQEILSARDDLGRLMFEAASGITGFGQLRDKLEAEAKTLWDRRHSGERLFYRGLDELREAEKQLKDSTVRVRDWIGLQDKLQEARAAFEVLRQKREELEIRRSRLERIRRVAPYMQRLRAEREAHEQVANAFRLPRTAAEDLHRAEREMHSADVLLAQATRALEAVMQRMQSITIDKACIDHATAIRSLIQQRVHTEKYVHEIRARQAELRLRQEEARSLAEQLNWQGDEEALERMIPPRTTCLAIQDLLQAHGGLSEAVASTSQAVIEKQNELSALSTQLEQLPDVSSPTRLIAALAAAQSLGDIEKRIGEAREQVRILRERIDRALQALQPWKGALEDLQRLVVPADAQVRAIQARDQELTAKLDAARAELQRAQDEAAAQRLQIQQLQQSKTLVTQADVLKAREERDALWAEIRENRKPLDASTTQLFTARIGEADRLADQRYALAADAAVLEQRRASLAQQELRLSQQSSVVAQLEKQIQEQQAEWSERLRAAGLPALSPFDFLDWSARRRSCLELAESLLAGEARLSGLLETAEGAASELRTALAGQGEAVEEGCSLGVLIARAADVSRRIEEHRAKRAALMQQHQNAQSVLSTLQARAARAQEDLAQWERTWASTLAATKLPADTSRTAASRALELFNALSACLKAIKDLRRDRIDVMQSELDAFAAAAKNLASQIAPELAGQEPSRIATELEQRLATAQAASEQLRAARQDRERREAEIAEARERRERAEAMIRPLMAQCGAANVDELRREIEKSTQLYRAEEAIETARRACLEHGDGLTLAELEAEIAGQEIAKVPGELQQLNIELSQLNDEQTACMQTIAETEAELKRYGAQESAAAAESRRQMALSTMAQAVERYIKVMIAARLLRWSIDRYRADKQAPLMRRASELFAILTRGSFEGLAVDFDARTPLLKGRRPNGKLIDVEGMSDGTRDQLFLALRLAALELQLSQGRALPFVADDLFVNFDDDRAAAGFEALAELATQTQVIFLTHHSHLVPIVEKTIGGPVSVMSL